MHVSELHQGSTDDASREAAVAPLRACLARHDAPAADVLAALHDARGLALGAWTLGSWRWRDPPDDLWTRMLLGPLCDAAAADWQLAAARLVEVAESQRGDRLLIDLEPDAAGHHRGYVADERLRALRPAFRDTTDVARWVLALHDGRPDARSPPARHRLDAADAHAFAAPRLWALLGRFHPARLVRAWQRGLWLRPPVVLGVDPRAPGAARAALVWTLVRFVRTLDIALPPGVTRPSPAHASLLARLAELHAAMRTDAPPAFITRHATGDASHEARAAARWIARFEAARERVTPADHVTSLAAGRVARALRMALAELAGAGHIAVEAGAIPRLADGLLDDLEDAPDARRVPRRLAARLMDAAVVEEVYADDATLAAAFARHLPR